MEFIEIMKSNSLCKILAIAIVLSGCNIQIIPIDVAIACDEANNGKYIEMEGFLIQPKEVFCTNLRGGAVTCDIELRKISGSASVRLEIEEGSGPNQFSRPMDQYNIGSISIFDNIGYKVVFSDKLRVTGKMRTGPEICFMTVYKIEKTEDKKR